MPRTPPVAERPDAGPDGAALPAGIEPARVGPVGVGPSGVEPAGVRPVGVGPSGAEPVGVRPVERHPCFSDGAHTRYGRIHVPVAPRCNIQCNYCVRRFDCPNENRPGVTTRVITPDEAIRTIGSALRADDRLTVLGVAGPGDALANEATFEVFARARSAFPGLLHCVSTNGLLLLDRLDELERAAIDTVTVTINAVDPVIGERIYARVRYRRTTYTGRIGFEILAQRQLEGLRQAARLGMTVKVNSVLIPGVNDHHMVDIARTVKALGAHTHNIVPMIPVGAFAYLPAPTDDHVERVRAACAAVIDQFRGCQRCRADAIGVPGEQDCAVLAAGVARHATVQGARP